MTAASLGASPTSRMAGSSAEPPRPQERAPVAPGRILVWTGRMLDAWPGGRDGWNTSRKQFLAALGRAEVVVLIDPVSLPWPMMGTRPDVPLLVVLPRELDVETLSPLLGQVLFSLVTPFDRLVHGNPDVRRALTEKWDLPEGVWLPWDGDDDSWRPLLGELLDDDRAIDELVLAKAQWVQPRLIAAESLSWALRTGPAVAGVMSEPTTTKENGASGAQVLDPERRRRVAIAGEVDGWVPLLSHSVRADFHQLAEFIGHPAGTFPLPAPDGVVIVLRDGDQSREERVRLFREAHDVLRPGAALVVLAHVVDTEDGRRNPSLTTLFEEVHQATGTSVHLDGLVSARWVGDKLTRGAVLRFISLRLREI